MTVDSAAINKIAEGLEAIRAEEARVQRAAGVEHTLVPTRANVSTFSLALVAEVVELANELQWKPWRLPTEPDAGRALEEIPDVLAFLGIVLNWLSHYGISMGDVAEGFAGKCELNVRRMNGKVEGYGVRS